MKMLKNICLSAMLFVTAYQPAASQETDYRPFGMGVAFTPFDMTALTGGPSVLPISSINFVYNATGKFRSELSLGLANVDNKTDKEKMNMASVGLGLFYTRRVDASVIMGGLRVEYMSGLSETEYGSNQQLESEISRISYGPAISYEYLLSKHFGLGAELGIKASNYKETTSMTGMSDEEFEVDAFYVQNLVFIRGYF